VKHPTIYLEDSYGHHIYKIGDKVLTDIKSVMIDGVLYPVMSRIVKVSISEMGHHSSFRTNRFFIKYKVKTDKGTRSTKVMGLDEFVWFDPEDEWFADEGPAEHEVLAVEYSVY
jgi:hypothetical protein